MKVRLPEGSRTRSMSFQMDGERVILVFDEKGEADVPADKAQSVVDRNPALTLVDNPNKKKSKSFDNLPPVTNEPPVEPVELDEDDKETE